MTLDERRRITAGIMSEAGVDLLIAASTGFHMIDLPNAVDHLAGVRTLGPGAFLLRRDGETELIATPAPDAERLKSQMIGSPARATDDLVGALRDAIAAKRLQKIGFAGLGALPHRLAASVRALGRRDAVDLDDRLFPATGAKTDRELADARKATVIAEAGYEFLRATAKPGLKECDLANAVNLHMRSLGAEDSFLMLNAGPRSDAVMPSSERPLATGDLILVELSPSVNGQFVQICRTASVGLASTVAEEKYALLIAAMHQGIGEAKAGAKMSTVCEAINDYLSAAGYADYSRPPFIKRRGHGLGAGSVWPGDVATDNSAVLEAGMLFVVHPNQYLPETGYMMCGEPVIVGKDDAEQLSKRGAALDSIAV